MRLVGQYGAGDDLATVYEAAGRLYVDGRGFQHAELHPSGGGQFWATPETAWRSVETFAFHGDGDDASSGVLVDGVAWPRRDIGAEVVSTIRTGLNADPVALRAQALAASPPAEPPAKRPMDLVPLASIDPAIKFDIRYATSNNFMGFPLYEFPDAFLQRPAAEALGRVQRALKVKGYGLLVFDAYRPWFVTKMFWDATPVGSRVFVADPSAGSRHNRGGAIDLTLYELSTGKPVEMTGRYDEFSKRSYAAFMGGTSRERWFRDLLRLAMEREGFQVYAQEWWHFDYGAWRDYGIGDSTFQSLVEAEARQKP
jgi:D-alanyl-D-alanine dipeptidase